MPRSPDAMRSSGMFLVYPSHARGALQNLKFPENREFNREFSGFLADSALSYANSLSDFNALQPNSLLSARGEIASRFQCVAGQFPETERTGNFFAGTGNFFGLTGNFSPEQGILHSPIRFRETTGSLLAVTGGLDPAILRMKIIQPEGNGCTGVSRPTIGRTRLPRAGRQTEVEAP